MISATYFSQLNSIGAKYAAKSCNIVRRGLHRSVLPSELKKDVGGFTKKSIAKKQPPSRPILKNLDPDQLASEMVRNSPNSRIQGTTALESITTEMKMKNFALAASLMGFCTWVWWYSIQSVGKSDGGIDELVAEAEDAKKSAEEKAVTEREVEELAQMDVTIGQLAEEIGDDAEDMIVAVAAPDDIASKEEDDNIKASKKGTGKKPVWKKIVFFWRRD